MAWRLGGEPMALLSRRRALIGAASACLPSPAFAAASADLYAHPGFRAWTRPARVGGLPLHDLVETDVGLKRVGDWLGRRPAVLAMWATWCAPCLVEKPHQAALARRLAASGAAARVLALQIYDDESLAQGRRALDRVGAEALPSARALPQAEDSFRRLLGSRADPSRAALPTVLLIGGDGLEIGRAEGMMKGVDGATDYWQDEATFDFLSRLR
jgi:thiol-disulfide isomerase/thioredoxin